MNVNSVFSAYYFLRRRLLLSGAVRTGFSMGFSTLGSICTLIKVSVISQLVEMSSEALGIEESDARPDLFFPGTLLAAYFVAEALISVLPYAKNIALRPVNNRLQSNIFRQSLSVIYADPRALITSDSTKLAVYRHIQDTEVHGINILSLLVEQLYPTGSDLLVNYVAMAMSDLQFLYVIPLYCFIMLAINQKVRDVGLVNERLSDINSKSVMFRRKIESDITNMQLIYMANKGREESASLNDLNEGYIDAQFVYDHASKKVDFYTNLVDYTIKGIVVLSFHYFMFSYASMFVFIMFIDQFTQKVSALSATLNSLELAVNNIQEIYSEKEPNFEKASSYSEDLHQIQDARDLEITFDQVSFKYPQQNSFALKNISFTVRPGETIAITGVSGAGKSTIIKLLTRVLAPLSGRILINGVDVSRIPEDLFFRLIGVLSQEVRVFKDRTVCSNLSYSQSADPGLREEEKRNSSVMATVGLSADLHNRPCSLLSGGQRQRVGLGRIIVQDPGIIVLDEYTSELDSFTEARVIEQFQRLAKERTALVVGHRLSTLQGADQILVLGENGEIIQRGSHEQLMANESGFYCQSWQQQTSPHLITSMPIPSRNFRC